MSYDSIILYYIKITKYLSNIFIEVLTSYGNIFLNTAHMYNLYKNSLGKYLIERCLTYIF